MTDTTDLKALREECAQWVKEAIGEAVDTRMALNGDGNDYMSWDMSVIWLAWLHLSGKLEAERQRADETRKTCDMYRDKFLSAEAEIATLKGDQVPVGWRFEDCENEPCTNGAVVSVGTGSDNIHLCAECSRNDKYKRQRTVALSQRLSLKVTAPQKPVVLPGKKALNPNDPSPIWCASKEWNSAIDASKAAIEAAGGIVKDGE